MKNNKITYRLRQVQQTATRDVEDVNMVFRRIGPYTRMSQSFGGLRFAYAFRIGVNENVGTVKLPDCTQEIRVACNLMSPSRTTLPFLSNYPYSSDIFSPSSISHTHMRSS
ncbi:hypothetical protein CBL_14557 [Carabus blaptoides fortunei]